MCFNSTIPVRGKRPPLRVPKTAKSIPVIPTPGRKGIVLYPFAGDEEDGEVASLEEGDQVTELKPNSGGWTTIQTTSGCKGKAPTSYLHWTVPTKGRRFRFSSSS